MGFIFTKKYWEAFSYKYIFLTTNRLKLPPPAIFSKKLGWKTELIQTNYSFYPHKLSLEMIINSAMTAVEQDSSGTMIFVSKSLFLDPHHTRGGRWPHKELIKSPVISIPLSLHSFWSLCSTKKYSSLPFFGLNHKKGSQKMWENWVFWDMKMLI